MAMARLAPGVARWRLVTAGVLILAAGIALSDAPDAAARVDPRNQVLDAAAIAKAGAGLPRLRGLLVSVNGEILFERYFNGATAAAHANIKSASKTIISALVGIAI